MPSDSPRGGLCRPKRWSAKKTGHRTWSGPPQRLARPHARVALAVKRVGRRRCWRSRCSSRCVPLFARGPAAARVRAATALIERRVRLGRTAARSSSSRFRELPGGAFGRALERVGARELPLLLAVLRGRLSFVGPRALPPGTDAGHTGPRRLMAPGLIGPAQRVCADAASRRRCGSTTPTSRTGRCGSTCGCSPGAARSSLTRACRRAARRPAPAAPAARPARAGGGPAAPRRGITNGTRKSQMRSVSAFVKPSTAGDRDHGGDRERLGRACASRRARATRSARRGSAGTPSASRTASTRTAAARRSRPRRRARWRAACRSGRSRWRARTARGRRAGRRRSAARA